MITDIRMPVMDGLSSMVYLKGKFPRMKVVLCSSESVAKMRAVGGGGDLADTDLAKKMQMLEKLAVRVRAKQVEAGKINSILEGCEKLVLDPIEMSKKLGAQGFVKKPVSAGKLSKLLQGLQAPSGFVTIEIA
ncbi:MAG: hypothetical protein MJK13_16990 [Pseudomonadales bacterium]|nr:hypothetical protein [Pseudomonadales bacterium]